MFVTAVNRVFINQLREKTFFFLLLLLFRHSFYSIVEKRKAAAVTKHRPSAIDDLSIDEKLNY
jgi:hypothetical protein